jgi:hypothetical protein
MLQVYVPNVSAVSDVCYKCFHLDVAMTIHICCNHRTDVAEEMRRYDGSGAWRGGGWHRSGGRNVVS